MVARYDRGGQHYLGTTVIARPTATTDHDKIAIAVDHASGPTAGNVYTAWVELSGQGADEYEQGRILFARSVDHGASFSEPIAVSRTRQGSFPDVAIGPDGAVYVTYRSGITIWITKSDTAGESFGSPWLVASVSPFDSEAFSGDGARDCGDGPFRCQSGFTFARFATQAAVTADETGVHVAWNGKHQGQSKVFVRNSPDGETWDRPAVQVDEVDEGHQFWPDIASAEGAIDVVFHDSREDAGYDPERPPGNTAEGSSSGGAIATFVARSTDGGLTWAEVQVSTSPSNFGLEVPFQIPFWGDYISIAAVPGRVFVAWTDSRDVRTGEDPLEPGSTGDTDGFDVFDRCTYSPRDMEAERFDSPKADDPCLAAGGYDENIYGAAVEPPPE
jgi:hypothetical protein